MVLIALFSSNWHPGPQGEIIGMYLIVIILSGLLSLPSMLILLFITNWLQGVTVYSMQEKKLILSVAGIVLTAVPIYIIGLAYSSTIGCVLVVTAPYALTIIAGIWYYNFD